MGLDGIQVLRELVEVLTKPLFCHLSAVLANWEGPSCLDVSKCGAHLQEGPEGGCGELQACESDLGAREGYGTDHLECHHVAHIGQPGDQAQPAWVHGKQVQLDQPDLLL